MGAASSFVKNHILPALVFFGVSEVLGMLKDRLAGGQQEYAIDDYTRSLVSGVMSDNDLVTRVLSGGSFPSDQSMLWESLVSGAFGKGYGQPQAPEGWNPGYPNFPYYHG